MSSVHLFAFFSAPALSIYGGAEENLSWFMGSSITSKPEQTCGCSHISPGKKRNSAASTNKPGLKQHLTFAKEHSLDSGIHQHWFPSTPSHRRNVTPSLIPLLPSLFSLLALGYSNPTISSQVLGLRALLEITKLQENTERANTWEQFKGWVRLLG